MRILGVNTSHDTSVAQITDDTIDFVLDEARFRRVKYWDPRLLRDDDYGLQCVAQRNIEKPDHLIFATFDRRNVKFHFDKEKLIYNRLLSEEFCADMREAQLSTVRLQELAKKYEGLFAFTFEEGADDFIAETFSKQLYKDDEGYTLDKSQHHLYHAECVHALSPWKGEECIAVVWDGGGAMRFFDEYPGYQEMETIFHCKPGEVPAIKWQRLSNNRALHDQSWDFSNLTYDCLMCWEDDVKEIDGVEIIFSSRPSSGMNFSQLSAALGCDEDGRAAGKVMGMASYGITRPNTFNQFTVAQQCEEEALANSLNIIDKAKELIPNTNKILLSGGYSLNCTNNYKYLEANPDYEFFVDPIPHDGGTALGAALWLKRKVESES
jgi:predicted NodU family carbamoyl transferase